VSLKTEGDIRERARKLAVQSGFVTILVAASFLLWTVLAFGSLFTAVFAALAAVALIGSFLFNLRVLRAGRSRSWPRPSGWPC
jgi:cytochrome d ubiquinol oxidase subunit II